MKLNLKFESLIACTEDYSIWFQIFLGYNTATVAKVC